MNQPTIEEMRAALAATELPPDAQFAEMVGRSAAARLTAIGSARKLQ